MQEQFSWAVVLKDDSLFYERNLSFSQVMEHYHLGKLKYLYLLSGDKLKFVVKLGGKRKPIFFRRRMNYIGAEGSLQWTLTAIGWEENVHGVSIKTLLYIYPNGNVELNNDEPTMAQVYHQELISQLRESNPMTGQSNEIQQL